MRPLTAEYERHLWREHGRLHPEGIVGKNNQTCDVCLLLSELEAVRESLNEEQDTLVQQAAEATRLHAENSAIRSSEIQLMRDRDLFRSERDSLEKQLLGIDRVRIRDAKFLTGQRDEAFRILEEAVATIRFPCSDCRPFIEHARMILGDTTWR